MDKWWALGILWAARLDVIRQLNFGQQEKEAVEKLNRVMEYVQKNVSWR